MTHEFVVRETGAIVEEKLLGNRTVRALYSPSLEDAGWLYKAASNRRISETLAYLNYDNLLSSRILGMKRFLRSSEIDAGEFVDNPESLNTPRKLFERKIRYWECRPLPRDEKTVVCPADSRITTGSTSDLGTLPIKNKFFDCAELLGGPQSRWAARFRGGDFAVFRLTPEKYHYTHSPVTGTVRDFYAVEGRYHSCNPNAIVQLLNPYSKNRRVVTILDTDCSGGTGVGLVAMIEVVALMVGQIEQRHSEFEYHDPQPVKTGTRLLRGSPKALFRPGSSTVVLLFQSGRVCFADDLLHNQQRKDVRSRYSTAFGRVMVETDVRVRSSLATPGDWRFS